MDFWSKFAKFYDVAESLNGKVYSEMCGTTTNLVPFHSRVLDCAAGTGALSIAAARKADSVLCTDNSEKMLEIARQKARRLDFDNICFERANIFHLDYADNSFDSVIAGNVLHLLKNPESAVKELCRVTKSGGKILLPTFMTSDKTKISSVLLSAYKKLGFEPCTEYNPRSYIHFLKGCNLGEVKAKLIKGTMPCCYAVIIKN